MHDHDFAPTRMMTGGGDGHQIRLGARVGEANGVNRRESPTDQFRQTDFMRVVSTEVDPMIQSPVNGSSDHGVRMAEQSGGIFPQEIQECVTVCIGDVGAVAGEDAKGKRVVKQHASCVATGHELSGPTMCRLRLRMLADISRTRFRQGVLKMRSIGVWERNG